MLRRLLPKTNNFFDFFEQLSRMSKEACAELDVLTVDPGGMESHAKHIKDIEHQADEITHRCIDMLHGTFITPIDRSDIHRLIRRLDDIIDSVDSIAARMLMYRVPRSRSEISQLISVLIESVDGIDKAVRDLPAMKKKGSEIHKYCWEVYEAESRADTILRSALVHLFEEENDPILIIKCKEILERLESATDRCQEVAHIISGIVIEAS
jgi:predicted phosphate transport protein (TIGR00153 family)